MFGNPQMQSTGDTHPSVSSWAAAKLLLYNALVLSWPSWALSLGFRGSGVWGLGLGGLGFGVSGLGV